MKKRLNFSIPDSNFVWDLNIALLQALSEHPEWFYDDFLINTCYGCPPSCIWNGNREVNFGRIDMDSFEDVLGVYEDYGLTYRLTFTNFLLEEKHLRDEYANAIAAVAARHKATAIVSTRMMFDYIRKVYPDLQITWSTTTDFGNTDEERLGKINELSATEMVVIPYDFNNKPILRSLQHPENIEVLVNEVCIDNCPMRREHERRSNLLNLEGVRDWCNCLVHDLKRTGKWQMHSFITRKGLAKYLESGIVNFKISGRTTRLQAFEAYLIYFVKEAAWLPFSNYCNAVYHGLFSTGKNPSEAIHGARRYDFISDDGSERKLLMVIREANNKVVECEKNDELW